MTKTSKRTHPLDRDGDGQPGGSLPGNGTAPMATTEAVDELADARTTPGDSEEKQDAINRETDEANAAARAAAAGADTVAADGADTVAADGGDTITADGADTVAADGADTITADGADTIDLAAATDALDQAFADSPDEDDDDATPTFGDDEVEAPLKGEDDEDEEPGLDASADRSQVAARIRDLTILVGARRLYKSDEGYSSNYGAPYVGHDTIAAFIQAGLAEDIPSAGNQGGVKLTAEARRMLADLKREAAT